MNKETIVIDGANAILGRLASFAAKQVLLGRSVVIVNCKDVVVSGNRNTAIKEYYALRQKGGSALNGPYYPKDPERMVKRTIRGMLSYKSLRGADALKRIMCYNNVPKEFEATKKIIAGKEKRTTTTKLSFLGERI